MLRDDVVVLWEGDLQVTPQEEVSCRALLSADELARADRFRFPRHRRRFTVARARLRTLLGALLDQDPGAVEFYYGTEGKPFVENGPSFNLSHTGDRVVIAVTPVGRLGVDIEEERPVRDMEALAHRNFSPDETDRVSRAAQEERDELFFRIWTRKEAFLKALGGGLSIPLHSFSIDPEDRDATGLLRVDDPAESRQGWMIRGIPCEEGAQAAVAIDRPGTRIEPLPFDPATLDKAP